MNKILLLYILFAATDISAQQNSTIKKIDTIHSAILKEDRYIWVHLPADIERNPTRNYPVVYLLDGEMHFEEVKRILGQLNSETGKNIPNEMIIVSIGNIWQRYRDYSPTHIDSSPWVDDHTAKTTGGGELFISFLEKELLPHMRSKYPPASERILIGHSMGGLAVINILLKHTAMFDHYAAIDPSMWWDNQNLLEESKTILTSKTFEKKTLFLAIANTLEKDMDVKTLRNDTSARTLLIRPSLKLVDYLYNDNRKLIFEWKFYEKHHHMTVPEPAMYDALKFFLRSLK